MFGFVKTFYIKPHERGLLFHRSHLQAVLTPGVERRMGFHWNVELFDLNDPQADIENLEFLLVTHADLLNQYLEVVRTTFNEAAIVQVGQQWFSVGPNQLQAFWRGIFEIEVQRFHLETTLELPASWIQPLGEQHLPGLMAVHLPESQLGLLYDRGTFLKPLDPGDHLFWTYGRELGVQRIDRWQPMPQFPQEEVLMERHPQFVESYCEPVHLGNQEVAIVRHQQKVVAVLPPCTRKLFWTGVTVERIAVDQEPKLPASLVSELVSGLPEVLQLAHKHLHIAEIPEHHVGLLITEGSLEAKLDPGWHVWWVFGCSRKTELVDLRLQTLEVAGQEILSKDKVPLRLNLTAGFRITDPVQARAKVTDIKGFLYKELQFGLRAAVGTRSLDELLEDKGSIDTGVADYILTKTADYGVEIESVGVKDIILPGEIKTILCQVVEAEKAAQANVIRRREETAATRSMLNTAKVMENNPVALRLKELEILERIADKIERIQVNGSLDSILTEMIRLSQPPAS